MFGLRACSPDDEADDEGCLELNALDEDKQCIVVRAANRKYAVIDRMQFNYGEIVAPQHQIDCLIKDGWFGDLTHATLNDIAGVLTKDAKNAGNTKN